MEDLLFNKVLVCSWLWYVSKPQMGRRAYWSIFKLGGLSMYAFFQPRISVAQEEADIKAMIDEEYEQREQEHIDYYKQMEEDYYKDIEMMTYDD